MDARIINHEWFRFFLALLLALVAARFYGQNTDSPDQYALGKNTSSHSDNWGNIRFTAPNVETITALVSEHRERLRVHRRDNEEYFLWLGNSQLHGINNYRDGDHTAPYWLKATAKTRYAFWPLGISLPNANFQEHYILSSYIASQLPIQGLILELVFDDLREDGLRAGVPELVPPATTSKPLSVSLTRDSPATESPANEKLETRLEKMLDKTSTLWSMRPAMRAQFLEDLYELRNFVFGINPTTVRKMIRPRYEKNMQTLEKLLADYQRRNIPMVLYIAPIRGDVQLPYDRGEYEEWKQAVQQLTQKYSATLLNFEALIPNQYWGAGSKGEIDFMHFRGEGHRIIADALAPYIGRVIVARASR